MLRQSPEARSTPELTHNFNDEVLIKVTPYGEEVWNDHYAELRLACKNPDAFPLKRDEDGYTTMQLWKVMSIFGPHLQPGKDAPVETSFRFCE